MMKTATGSVMLRAMLQQTLKISTRLTSAEESSLFLLNADGMVTESILARGAVIREQKQTIIGKVLDKGLAGWVIRHRKVGLIADTLYDERWLTLPSQPYTVRSALAVPILRGKVLLGIITLMHSEPGNFTDESAHLMQMTAAQMALVLDSAQLFIERQQLDKEFYQTDQQTDKELPQTDLHTNKDLHQTREQLLSEEALSLVGIYIIIGYGKFLYANPRLADIFGYTFDELLSLESIFDLITASHCSLLAKQMNECFQGQNQSLCCSCQGQRKDGSLIDIEIYGKRTKFYGKSVIIGLLKAT
jgi:PAS domain S-box-containing protein